MTIHETQAYEMVSQQASQQYDQIQRDQQIRQEIQHESEKPRESFESSKGRLVDETV